MLSVVQCGVVWCGVVALHTFSHHHVSGSDSDPNNQNDMQIYVRVPLRKRRGLIVTLSYDARRGPKGTMQNSQSKGKNQIYYKFKHRNEHTNCRGPSNGSNSNSNSDCNFNFNDDDAASYRFRHSSVEVGDYLEINLSTDTNAIHCELRTRRPPSSVGGRCQN